MILDTADRQEGGGGGILIGLSEAEVQKAARAEAEKESLLWNEQADTIRRSIF